MNKATVAIRISDSEYTQLWQRSQQQISTTADRQSETIDLCPPAFGTGSERWIALPGIKLLIIDLQFDEGLEIEYLASEPESYVEFGFNILGSWNERSGGTNFLDLAIDRSDSGGIHRVHKGERIRKVDIHLEPSQLFSNLIADGLDYLPPELNQVINGKTTEFYSELDVNTPAMKLAVEQILNCPFQAFTKTLYLESKCLELIALKLEQLNQDTAQSTNNITLKADDIERIHQARDILVDRLQQPPSLAELARLVGLNDSPVERLRQRKLKQGFHQVFDTTVFGYLHEYRMSVAMQSLVQGNTTIDRVIRSIGYASRSSFSRAFKKRFGASPCNYRSQ